LPKTLPIAIRTRALELYLDGLNGKEIVKILKLENVGLAMEPSTVYHWADMGDWKSKRSEVENVAVATIIENKAEALMRIKEEHLDDYEKLRKKASRQMESLDFDDAAATAKAIDMSIRGQREVMTEMVNESFMQSVVEIIVEEVSDPAVKARIGERLRRLANG
jgi:hypothetical protein